MTINNIPQQLLLTAMALVAFVLVTYLYRVKIKHAWLNLKTRYYLKQLGVKQVSNIQCPDGLGHYFTIDRLILRDDGITLLTLKKYPGKIYCADHIDNWTQMLGLKSYQFKNPFYDLDCQIRAVSACVPGIPVNGYLFFEHQAEFPRGCPDRVIHLEKIPQELKPAKQKKVKAPIMSAWKKLLAMTKS